ncbi:MAG: hypothetical protein KC419_17115 [Anaerolineales bacterium]|nr:hypothetical protein [Anaerolineales bacterium]
MKKVWLDDVRPAPAEWALARSYDEAIALLAAGDVVEINLDYDLNVEIVSAVPGRVSVATFNDNAKTGYDVARWIEDAVRSGRISAPIMRCHSINPAGHEMITAVIERISLSLTNID